MDEPPKKGEDPIRQLTGRELMLPLDIDEGGSASVGVEDAGELFGTKRMLVCALVARATAISG